MATTTTIRRNMNISPEAQASTNRGRGLAMVTPTQQPTNLNNAPATSLQQGGVENAAARDVLGSKLVESLQGAKTQQMNEVSNRLAAQGITGGQAASQLSQANRDYMLGISQGLGQFNIDRLNQAAGINRDYLQLELQRELGLGNLQLGSAQLDAQIALRLSELAQNADANTKAQINNLLQTYFGGGTP